MCGAELDELQTHALICQLQGSTVHRHNRIRDSIAHILRESGQYNDVQIEQLVPEASENSVAPRMDIIAHGPLGQRDLIDVTVACAHTPTALRCGSGTRMGVAAHMLEINKYRKHPGVQVRPAALESGGRPGDGLVNLIRKLGRNMNKTERAKFIDEAWQQISAPDWKRPSSHRIAQRHILAHGCFPGSSVLRQCQGAVYMSTASIGRVLCPALLFSPPDLCFSQCATSMAHM